MARISEDERGGGPGEWRRLAENDSLVEKCFPAKQAKASRSGLPN